MKSIKTFSAGPMRSGKPWAARRALAAIGQPITSKTNGGLTVIGVDYGSKQSIAVVVQHNADGSFTVVDEWVGLGLDDLDDDGAPIRTRT